jgi:hypothetical protein
MFRKFKLYVHNLALLGLLTVIFPIDSLGFLSREEAFERSFDLVWETVEESHWDETFGGLDWDAIGKKYRSKLNRARNRTDLVTLLQDMLNELDLSHYNIISSSENGWMIIPVVDMLDWSSNIWRMRSTLQVWIRNLLPPPLEFK